ncbi:MAG: hypothetical protein KKH94_11935 [Candidatus Omnitrophica bacterium]|nr:hypothetical protein [Candidatus Omnitrophota bacterium]
MKKNVCYPLIFFIAFCVIILSAVPSLIVCSSADAEEAPALDLTGLTFSTDSGNMYFYNEKNQTIYIYSSRGEFRRAFQLEKLGGRLKSLTSAEIRMILQDTQDT